MTRRLTQTVIFIFSLSCVCIGGWVLLYPESNDPKNIKYILWKADLCQIDLDVAAGTMIGDSGAEKLVVGKTKAQLQNRFGSLLSPAEVSPYLRDYYQNSLWKDRDVLFIRQSPWMVVFDGEKATNLLLIKG
jgi:hypothetical protein